jgi:hypothetical protein
MCVKLGNWSLNLVKLVCIIAKIIDKTMKLILHFCEIISQKEYKEK